MQVPREQYPLGVTVFKKNKPRRPKAFGNGAGKLKNTAVETGGESEPKEATVDRTDSVRTHTTNLRHGRGGITKWRAKRENVRTWNIERKLPGAVVRRMNDGLRR